MSGIPRRLAFDNRKYDWSLDDGYRNFREWVREAPTLKEIVREAGV